MLAILLPLFFLVMYGVFDAIQTVVRDFPKDNCIRNYCFRLTKSRESYINLLNVRWYCGNNPDNNPAYFWTSDCWHLAKWGRLYSMSAMVGVLLAPYIHWWALGFPLLAHVEGVVFSINYHYILRTGETKANLWKLLLHLIELRGRDF